MPAQDTIPGVADREDALEGPPPPAAEHGPGRPVLPAPPADDIVERATMQDVRAFNMTARWPDNLKLCR